MNTPNKLTLLRIALIPVLVLSLYYRDFWIDMVSVVIFSVAAITDYYDGYLARKYNLITDFGKIMDPVADKLLITTALVCLVERGDLAAYLVVLALGREFAATALRAVASSYGYVMPADNYGKWKMGLQIAAVIGLILRWDWVVFHFHTVGVLLLWISVALAYYSLWRYVMDYRNYKKTLAKGER